MIFFSLLYSFLLLFCLFFCLFFYFIILLIFFFSNLLNTCRVVSTVSSAAAAPAEENSNLKKFIQRLETEGIQRIRMFTTICSVYALFWGPLFLVVIFGSRSSEEGRGLASVGPPQNPAWHQVSLYICFAHAFINPTVFLALHAGLKDAASRVLCCFLASHANMDDEDDYRTLHLDNVNYDRIINFNGTPSFLPLLPPLPPPPPSALFSQDIQSHHM